MKKIIITTLVISILSTLLSCKKENELIIDNPNIFSVQIDSSLRSFYPQPDTSSTSATIYNWNFNQDPLNIASSFTLFINWNTSPAYHGIYLHFNNQDGDILLDNDGFVKAFDSGITLDSTLAGNWSGINDGIISYDYIAHPDAIKGNLAGKGDKYIAFRAHSINPATAHFKHYGWMRIEVSANGRAVKIIAIGFQKIPNTSLYTGEL